MTRRPSLRSVVTTLAAAAVLVGGANLASYAATGNALVLGHANNSVGTTSLKNAGRGPALSLNSASRRHRWWSTAARWSSTSTPTRSAG